jgi:hypothetical protein
LERFRLEARAVTLVFSSVAGSVIGLLVIAPEGRDEVRPALRDIFALGLVSSLASSISWVVCGTLLSVAIADC